MSDPIESSSEMPNLEANCSDVGAMVVRSTVGLIPFAGPIISELITHFIPNQRQDRIADYVRRLNEKTERFDRNAFRNTATTTDGIDLFEDGAFQSARATSDERREYIANVVAYGLSGEQKERIEAKRILNILSQIDDQQIIILASQHEKYLFDDDFRDRHENILTPPFAHFQSDEDEIAQEAMYDVALDQLFKLGLLKRQFKAPRSTSDLSFDPKTGMLKSTGKSISAMGRLILRRIGLTEDENEPG